MNTQVAFVAMSLCVASTLNAGEVPKQWASLAAEVNAVGGTISFASGEPIAIDLYNGNNPLKGRGGRNEAVNDDWLHLLVGIKSLRKLSLANTSVTDAGMECVGTLSGLEELDLTLTSITDAGFAHFGKLTRLRNLGLASSQCNGTGFAHLAVKNLQNVNFHYTPLNDAGMEAICNVGVTGRFWFAHTHFTDAGAKHLAKLSRLKVVGIGSKEEESTGQSVAALVGLPLTDLSLLDRQADPEGFSQAAKIKTLKKLDASYAPSITDAELKLIAGLPALQELRLGGAAKVTDAGLESLAGCTSLKKLSLQQLKGITPSGVARLRQARPDLELTVK